MASSDGSVKIDILGDAKPFEQSIDKSIKSAKSAIGSLGNSISELNSKFNSSGQNLSNFNSQIDYSSKSISGLGTNANQAKSTVQELDAAVTSADSNMLSLGQASLTANSNVLSLGTSASNANNGLQLMGSASLATNKNIQLLGSGATETQNSFQNLGTRGTESINALAAAFAAAGLANVAKSLVSALGECVSKFSSFESQMSKVQSTSGATAAEMQELTEKAKEMGATTSFTAEQAGEALQYMAMAGWDTQEMLDGLDGVMQLAAASGEDLGSVSDILTDAITAFGDSASDASRYADVLASTASSANTDVRGIGEACKYVAPVAGTLGYKIEDVALALGLMANSSVKSSMAGTSLRSMLNALSGTSKTANAAFEQLNFSITTQDGKVKPLRQSLTELREKLGGLSEAQQTQYAKSIAGTEAMSGFLAIVNSSEEDFNNLATAIDNSAGAAERMADIRLDNLEGSLTLLDSALDGLQITIGSQLAPAFKFVVDVITGVLNSINSLAEVFPFVGAAIAGFTAEITALAIAVGALTIFKVITPLVYAFNAACVANPYIQVALAIIAIGTAVAALVSYFVDATSSANESSSAMDELGAETNKATTALKGFGGASGTAAGAGRKLGPSIQTSAEAYRQFSDVVNNTVGSLEELEKEYAEAAESAKESISSQFDIWEDLSGAIDEHGLNIKKTLESQVEYRRTFSSDVESLNQRNIKGLNNVVQNLVQGANEGSKECVNALHWMAQQNDYSLNQVIDTFSDLAMETKRASEASAVALTDYGGRAAKIFEGIAESADALDMSDKAYQAGVDTIEGYIRGIKSKEGGASSTMINTAKNIWSTFKKGLDMNSPSKLFMQGGEWTMEGYKIGVDKKSKDVSKTMDNAASNVANSFNVSPNIKGNNLKSLIMQMNEAVSAEVGGFTGKVTLAADARRSANSEPKTITNDNGIVVNLTYYGTGEPTDVKKIGRQLGIEAQREMRRRGVLA